MQDIEPSAKMLQRCRETVQKIGTLLQKTHKISNPLPPMPLTGGSTLCLAARGSEKTCKITNLWPKCTRGFEKTRKISNPLPPGAVTGGSTLCPAARGSEKTCKIFFRTGGADPLLLGESCRPRPPGQGLPPSICIGAQPLVDVP